MLNIQSRVFGRVRRCGRHKMTTPLPAGLHRTPSDHSKAPEPPPLPAVRRHGGAILTHMDGSQISDAGSVYASYQARVSAILRGTHPARSIQDRDDQGQTTAFGRSNSGFKPGGRSCLRSDAFPDGLSKTLVIVGMPVGGGDSA